MSEYGKALFVRTKHILHPTSLHEREAGPVEEHVLDFATIQNLHDDAHMRGDTSMSLTHRADGSIETITMRWPWSVDHTQTEIIRYTRVG